ncbi:MAG: aa3-type cytochrome oxidase subunit IV [Acidimicrobiales bacterium]
MRVEWKLFVGAGGFLAVTMTTYWFVTYEEAGTALLGLAMAAVLMVGGWLAFQSQRVGLRPEDRPDATPADGAAVLGYFPSSSIWPFVIGCGAVVMAAALAFGVWLGLTGAVIVVVGVVGFAVEANSKA